MTTADILEKAADIPVGAITTQEAFVKLVKQGGRQKKTIVFYVIAGPAWEERRRFRPFMEEREYIWPLKISDHHGSPFVADVRGRGNSFGDMLPNTYNHNFAFARLEDAQAYLDEAAALAREPMP